MKKPHFKRIILLALILVVIAGGIVAATMLTGNSDPEMAEIRVTRQDLTKYYSFTGNIEAKDAQYVIATSSDPIRTYYVKEGDKVKKGDLLFETDNASLSTSLTNSSTALSSARSTYESQRLNFERTQSLYEEGAVSLSEFESARDALTSAANQVKQAEANYAQSQDQYQKTKYYAEVDGEVTEIYADANMTITAGTKILDVVNYDKLQITVKVDEYDLAEITEGMDAEVAIEALGKSITGTITDIAREASVENGVSYFSTTVDLAPDPTVRIGLSAEVKVVTQSVKNAVTVPVKAITYMGSGTFVQVNNAEQQLEMKPVQVGVSDGTSIEIKQGLQEGDTIFIQASTSSSQSMGIVRPPMGTGGGGGGSTAGGQRPVRSSD